MQFAERGAGPADVGGARLGEQPGLEDHRGQAQRGVPGGGVEGGHAHQVPQRLDGARRLAVAAQPAREVLRVQRRVQRVEPPQGERGAAHQGALGEREVRVGGEARGQVQRHRQGGAAQPAEPPPGPRGGVHHGYVQPPLERGERGGADPVQEPLVGGAAAQVDVLAVVDGQLTGGEERRNEKASPPSRGRPSASVTRTPASASASAAVIPASPPPMTHARPPPRGGLRVRCRGRSRGVCGADCHVFTPSGEHDAAPGREVAWLTGSPRLRGGRRRGCRARRGRAPRRTPSRGPAAKRGRAARPRGRAAIRSRSLR